MKRFTIYMLMFFYFFITFRLIIIVELLRINDDINNAFVRYERFQKSLAPESDHSRAELKPDVGVTSPVASLNASDAKIQPREENLLIDFDEEASKPSKNDALVDFSSFEKRG